MGWDRLGGETRARAGGDGLTLRAHREALAHAAREGSAPGSTSRHASRATAAFARLAGRPPLRTHADTNGHCRLRWVGWEATQPIARTITGSRGSEGERSYERLSLCA